LIVGGLSWAKAGKDSRVRKRERERERETFITELGEGRKTTLKGELKLLEIKLREAKATGFFFD